MRRKDTTPGSDFSPRKRPSKKHGNFLRLWNTYQTWMYMWLYVCIYIYIYYGCIYQIWMYMCVYMYIYIYVCVCVNHLKRCKTSMYRSHFLCYFLVPPLFYFNQFHFKCRGQRYPCHFLCQRSWVTCGKDIDQGRLIYVPAIFQFSVHGNRLSQEPDKRLFNSFKSKGIFDPTHCTVFAIWSLSCIRT